MKKIKFILAILPIVAGGCKRNAQSKTKFVNTNGTPALQILGGEESILQTLRSQLDNQSDFTLAKEVLAQFKVAASYVTSANLGHGQTPQPIYLTGITLSRVKESSGVFSGSASIRLEGANDPPESGSVSGAASQGLVKPDPTQKKATPPARTPQSGNAGLSTDLTYRTNSIAYNLTFHFRDSFSAPPPGRGMTPPSPLGMGNGEASLGPSLGSDSLSTSMAANGVDFSYALPGGLHVQSEVELSWNSQAEFDLSTILTMQPAILSSIILLAMKNQTLAVSGKLEWNYKENLNLPPEMAFELGAVSPITDFSQRLRPMFQEMCQRSSALRTQANVKPLNCTNSMENVPGALTKVKSAMKKNMIMRIALCEKVSSSDYLLYFPVDPELFFLTEGATLTAYATNFSEISQNNNRIWKKTDKTAVLRGSMSNDSKTKNLCKSFLKKGQMCMTASTNKLDSNTCAQLSQNTTFRPLGLSISKQKVIYE